MFPHATKLMQLITFLEPFQATAPDTSGSEHVTWQKGVGEKQVKTAEVKEYIRTVTQNEQQDGTGEVRRINS